MTIDVRCVRQCRVRHVCLKGASLLHQLFFLLEIVATTPRCWRPAIVKVFISLSSRAIALLLWQRLNFSTSSYSWTRYFHSFFLFILIILNLSGKLFRIAFLCFSRPWKSIIFGWNVHKILGNYGNSKFNHLFIQILFFTTDDSSADVFTLCSMSNIFKKWS